MLRVLKFMAKRFELRHNTMLAAEAEKRKMNQNFLGKSLADVAAATLQRSARKFAAAMYRKRMEERERHLTLGGLM